MKTRGDRGLATVDMIIAIIAIMIFSSLIVSMMYSNVMENVKLKKETLAMIYMTEIFENVGRENYSNLSVGTYEDITVNTYDEYIEGLIPEDLPEDYIVDIVITNNLEGVKNNEDILKKVELTLTYKVGEKIFSSSMERMKIKE